MKDSRPLSAQPLPDWKALYHRLEQARIAIERDFAPGDEEKQLILKTRAQQLAREPERQRVEDSLEIVHFLLAQEQYAVESKYVREVYPLKEFTSLPSTPPFVLGIIYVRGQILSVIDLKKFFDLPEKGLTDLNKVIIVQTAVMELGILADALRGVYSLPLSELQSPLPTLTGIRAEYLRGVTHEGIIVLDVVKLLSDPKLIVQEGGEIFGTG